MSDTIDRQAAIDYFVTNVGFHDEDGYPIEDECELREIWTGYFDGIPSAQPDTYWKEQCQSYEQTINKLRESLSAKSESFEWCTDCKEYDQEKHCCPRWNKVIRDTVAELKLVHCHECQYSEYDSIYRDRYCHYNGKAEVVDDYHYCRDGEKRDDEVTCENCYYSEQYVDGLILCRRTRPSHRVSATSTCGKGKREVTE